MMPKILDAFKEWKPLVLGVGTVVAAIFTTGWGTAWYVATTVDEFTDGRTEIQGEIKQIRVDLVELEAQMTDDRYTLTAASEKALRTAIENPGMRVPDPRDPSTVITVKASP